MSDGVDNSSGIGRNFPKPTLHLDTAACRGIDLSNIDVDDEVTYIVKGKVKSKAISQFEKGELSAAIRITEVHDQTPRKDRDETNRLI